MSIIGLEPTRELVGKENQLLMRLLHPRATAFYELVRSEFGQFVQSEQNGALRLHIPQIPFDGPEDERLERQNIVQPLRRLLAAFKTDDKNFMGFYGALAYQFVYLFEDMYHKKACTEPDFHLFLFDNILLFNHLTQDLSLYVTRDTREAAHHDLDVLLRQLDPAAAETPPAAPLTIGKFKQSPDDDTFKRPREQGIRLCN